MAKRAPILNSWTFVKTGKTPLPASHRSLATDSNSHAIENGTNCPGFRRLLIATVAVTVAMGLYNRPSEAFLDLYTLQAMSSSSSRSVSIVAGSTAPATSEIRSTEIREMEPVDQIYSATATTTIRETPTGLTSSGTHESTNFEENSSVSYVHYVGCCGIGHRLARMSNAYHAAQRLNYALKGSWPSCQKTNVFEHLFEQENAPWLVGKNYSRTGQSIKFNNEVPGYTTVRRDREEMVKKREREVEQQRQRQLSSSSSSAKLDESCDTCHWLKIDSDYNFFSQLLQQFRHRHRVETFQRKHTFPNHTVIGMHVRAGNGEGGDFANKKRGIDDTSRFVETVSQHVQRLVQQEFKIQSSPPLLFLATDTPYMIDMFRQQLKNVLPVVELPQMRPSEGDGILFGERKRKRDYVKFANNSNAIMEGIEDDDDNDNESNATLLNHYDSSSKNSDEANRQTCLLGWDQAFMDMMLLASSDVVLATRRSSFVQTIPMSMVLGKPVAERKVRAPYCEISEDETLEMTCHETYMDWCCCTSCVKQDQNDDFVGAENDDISNVKQQRRQQRNNEYVKQLRPELWEKSVWEVYDNRIRYNTKKKKHMNKMNKYSKRHRRWASSTWQ